MFFLTGVDIHVTCFYTVHGINMVILDVSFEMNKLTHLYNYAHYTLYCINGSMTSITELSYM